MKNAQITDVSDSVGQKYALSVISKYGNFVISFQSSLLKTTWEKEFIQMRTRLTKDEEYSSEVVEEEKREEQKHENKEEFALKLNLPFIRLKWLEADHLDWIEANLNQINTSVIVYEAGFKFNLGIESFHALCNNDVPRFNTIA
jgi:hypothetical protein